MKRLDEIQQYGHVRRESNKCKHFTFELSLFFASAPLQADTIKAGVPLGGRAASPIHCASLCEFFTFIEGGLM